MLHSVSRYRPVIPRHVKQVLGANEMLQETMLKAMTKNSHSRTTLKQCQQYATSLLRELRTSIFKVKYIQFFSGIQFLSGQEIINLCLIFIKKEFVTCRLHQVIFKVILKGLELCKQLQLPLQQARLFPKPFTERSKKRIMKLAAFYYFYRCTRAI